MGVGGGCGARLSSSGSIATALLHQETRRGARRSHPEERALLATASLQRLFVQRTSRNSPRVRARSGLASLDSAPLTSKLAALKIVSTAAWGRSNTAPPHSQPQHSNTFPAFI